MKYRCEDIKERLSKITNSDANMHRNLLTSIINGSISEDPLQHFRQIKKIDRCGLYNLDNITSVSIPVNIQEIEALAFNNCDNLTNVYLHSIIPPRVSSSNAFGSTCTFHVPIGSEEAYKSATNWSGYADRIVGDIIIESEE